MTRAGYIPQLFTLRLPNPLAIYSLMQKAGAVALVYEPFFSASVVDSPVPIFLAVPQDSIDVTGTTLPHLPTVSDDDIAFVFHTSGSTSGSPKLVRCTYRWLGSAIHKSNIISKPFSIHRQDVTVWMCAFNFVLPIMSLTSICKSGEVYATLDNRLVRITYLKWKYANFWQCSLAASRMALASSSQARLTFLQMSSWT